MTAFTESDLLLGTLPSRAIDGVTLAVPFLRMSETAWQAFVAISPYADWAGTVVLSGAAATAWASLGTAAQTDLLATGVVRRTGSTLRFTEGIQGYGGLQNDSYVNLAFTAATADAAVLYTVPASTKMVVVGGVWAVSAVFSGGASPTIGLSSSNAASNTKGDLLGGVAGDGVSVLGTLSTRVATAGTEAPALLVAGDSIRFDRITDAFAAGVGSASLHVVIADA